MDAERREKGELMVLMLNTIDDEDAAAAALGHGAEDEETQVKQIEPAAGVDQTLGSDELKRWQAAPTAGGQLAAATRGVLSGEKFAVGSKPEPPESWARDDVRVVGLVEEAAIFNGCIGTLTGKCKGGRSQVRLHDGGKKPYLLPENMEFLHISQRTAAAAAPNAPEPTVVCNATPLSQGVVPLASRERPGEHPAVVDGVRVAAERRTGDWRYSVLPGAVPRATIQQLSSDFFEITGLLVRDGNTFGPEFEEQYAGHKNYFYYMNRNEVVAGAEAAAPIFEALDVYTRQVVDLHHPGVAVRLERAFGAYYEGERDGFHLGVNEHCDGDANLVSTVVHAVLPDGDVGFTRGGELTISEVDGLPAEAITHSNETVGSVVYLGGSIFHHASPIQLGQRRLVFCMFYACSEDTDLSKHALA